MRNTNLWQGVVGYWSATAGPSGYRLLDRSGRSNHGTLTNMDAATDWVIDGGRYALDFDGSNDFVDVTPGMFLVSSSYTISMWIKRDGFVQYANILTRGTGNSDDIEIYHSTVNLMVVLHNRDNGGTLGLLFFPPPPNLTWTHMLITYSSLRASGATNRWQVFYNGVLQTSVSGQGTGEPPLSVNTRWQIGTTQSTAFGATKHYKGQLDDLIIWDRVLGNAEGRQLYQIGRGGMLTPRRRRRAYFAGVSGLRRRLLLTGQV
jgi:hypothetical protein